MTSQFGKSLGIALVASLWTASALATTGFQCYKKDSSPRRESNYVIFARLNYLDRNSPISGADIQLSKNNWVSVEESSVKKFSRHRGVMKASLRVNSVHTVELELNTNEQDGTGAGKMRVLETKVVQARSGKRAKVTTVKETAVSCLFDEML